MHVPELTESSIRITGSVRIDHAFDQFQRAVLLALLADKQTAIAIVLKDAGLKNRNAGQTVRSNLATVEAFK
jgi:hypothetical protein